MKRISTLLVSINQFEKKEIELTDLQDLIDPDSTKNKAIRKLLTKATAKPSQKSMNKIFDFIKKSN